jgi:hypothetical protein
VVIEVGRNLFNLVKWSCTTSRGPVLASSSWTVKFVFDLVALVVGMGVGADLLVVIFLEALIVF